MITMKCEKCQMIINTPDDYAGRKIECKQCHAVLLVPQARANYDSVFGEIRYVGQDVVDMQFRRLFQALLQQEQQAPAFSDEPVVSAQTAATNE